MNIMNKIRSYQKYRRTVRELSVLTDRELRDLGLNRCDILAIARSSI